MSTQNDEQQIRELVSTWMAATKAGDIEKVLTVVVTPAGGGPSMIRAGHTLSVLKKHNGKWVLARDANMLAPVSS